MEDNRITIYPDKRLREKLNKKAKEDKRSLNNLILLILEDHLEK